MEDVPGTTDAKERDHKDRPTLQAAPGQTVDTLAPVSSPPAARLSPLVDRDDELQRLKSFVEGAIRGNGCVVYIAGEAGIGKTRLAEELAEYATSRGVRFLQGTCLGEKEVAPYYPWIFRDADRWARRPISEIQIPTSVKAVIDQRLARFDEESLRVLVAASVLG